jgi:hypothetical protein
MNQIAINTRVNQGLLDRIENWRRAQPRIPQRAEALRELLEMALAADRRRMPAQKDQSAPA